MRPRRHRSWWRARVARVAVVFVATLLATAGIAWAVWTVSTSNPGNSISGANLAAPANVNGAKAAGGVTQCTSVTVSWTASAAPVNTYVVEARTANGSWTVINGDTGNVTSISDTTTYTQSDVAYRVTGGYKTGGGTLTSWATTQVADVTPLLCGNISEVDDLAVTTGCMSANFTWSLPGGATRFDRQYRINGGAWVTTTNNSATSFSLTTWTAAAPGDDIEFQVRPETTTANGSWTPITTVTDIDCTVQSLVSTPSCTGSSISYGTPHADTAAYDRQYTINGGAAVASSNQTATTWAPTAAGPNVVVQVRGQNASGTQGSWVTLPAADWGFFVKSVTLVDTGTALRLDSGDQVIVTFSRDVDATTVTKTTIYTTNTAPRGLYLAATAGALTNTDIGYVAAVNGFWNSTGSRAGNVTWSSGRSVWTWTSTVSQAAIMDGAISGAWSVGTSGARATCATDGTTTLNAYAPTISGSF